ncbi:hypothetical protein [Actinoplanes sp. NPDC089786]|uniref:hypothetical protein n=1 Tax=Actinoplanes sp. NPDC089786 TaxID=3155185 RepID=UPI00342C27C5
MYHDEETPLSDADFVPVPDRGSRRVGMLATLRSPGAAGRVQRGFDDRRPGWLDDPAFVPADVTPRGLAGSHGAVLDVNRPELGANFDSPEFGARSDHADWDDEIDEPFDHRRGMGRGTRPRGRGRRSLSSRVLSGR